MKQALRDKHLPIFKYPTSTVLIDDESEFLNSVAALLNERNPITTFTNSKEAQAFILENEKFKPNISSFLNILPPDDIGEISIRLKYNELFKDIHNKAKTNNISTVIVDYDMPGLNGIELCKSLSDTNSVKILLSGSINDTKVIDAFNHGVVDYFISKHSPTLIEELNKLIDWSNELYFLKISSFVSQCLSLDYHRSSYLDTLQFIRFFKTFLMDKNIVEYYLISPYGYYLMKNRKGEISNLYTCSGNEFKYALEIVPDMLDSEIKKSIKNKKLLLINPAGEISMDNVNNLICSCERIPGASEIYYSHIN